MKNILTHTAFLTLVMLAFVTKLSAQVPQLISYQGRVGVDGVNFDGSGQFKFAFVNAAGTTTYWSNDGSSMAGREPDKAISIPVSKGLYSVLLGDATLAHMSIVPATVFTNGDVHLRVWFSDGVNGFQQLAPDRRIAAVGYAMMADSVSDGAITTAKIADGAVTSAKLANGSIGSAQLAVNAVQADKIASGAVGAAQLATGAAAANLNSAGQSGVPSGGLVLSATENAALIEAGYIKIGETSIDDTWQQRNMETAPSPRTGHTAVWTGTEMIVWGGTYNNTTLADGGRYNPSTHNWILINNSNGPGAQATNTAVWTGTNMIVWGNEGRGASYKPATDTWTPINTTNSPQGQYYHTAIWTGSEMIVWGGGDYRGMNGANSGSRYEPATDTWSPISTTNAPQGRAYHSAVWTGSEMIVWGGNTGSQGWSPSNDGGRYNPTNDTWTQMSSTNAPRGRGLHTAVWTGSEMIVWGGGDKTDSPGSVYGYGRYNPSANGGEGAWITSNTIGLGDSRIYHTAVWAGNEMIIFGGATNSSVANMFPYLNNGLRYDSLTGISKGVNTTGSPDGSYKQKAVWTGREMIVWGGTANSTYIYTPGRQMYLYQRP